MKRKNIKGIFSRPMDADAKPVIDNDKLPAMPVINQKLAGVLKNPPAGKGYMPVIKETDMKANRAAVTQGLQMAPFDPKENKKTNLPIPESGYQDQAERSSRKKPGTGYVVLRMRVQNGQVTVQGSRHVAGEFLAHENLVQTGITYEAFVKESRIAIGSLPDFGEQRSFARPGADASQEGHHITILPSFDFNVKIAADRITIKDLPKLKLNLYTFKEHVPDLKLSAAPLNNQFAKEVRLVAEMNGIHVAKLQKEVQEALRVTFKK
ncbi:MAG: hypothetical protein ABIU63_18105 [Chitinophagaceae bacterium]